MLLAISAILLGATALGHSVLGERLVLRRIEKLEKLPALPVAGRDLMRPILRFAWHITSFFMGGFAAILALMALDSLNEQSIAAVIGVTFLLSGALSAIASGGRHFSWVIFLIVGGTGIHAAFATDQERSIPHVGQFKERVMHGMNVRAQIQPGKIEEAAKVLREEVMPAAANYKGFIQNVLIVDAPNNRLATLSIWETESDAKAIYEDQGGLYQSAIAKLKPLMAGPPDPWLGPLTRVDK